MYTHSKCSLIKVKVLLKRLIIVIICPRSHENILKEGERNSTHQYTENVRLPSPHSVFALNKSESYNDNNLQTMPPAKYS